MKTQTPAKQLAERPHFRDSGITLCSRGTAVFSLLRQNDGQNQTHTAQSLSRMVQTKRPRTVVEHCLGLTKNAKGPRL